MTPTVWPARYGPVLDELPLPDDELLLLAELLLAELLLADELLVADDVLVAEVLLVVDDAPPAPVVASMPPSGPLLLAWQLALVLPPAGQQTFEVAPSTTRQKSPSAQSSLPVVGSVGVAETSRLQRWPSP